MLIAGLSDIYWFFLFLMLIALVAWVGQWGRRNQIAHYLVFGIIGLVAVLLLGFGGIIYGMSAMKNVMSGSQKEMMLALAQLCASTALCGGVVLIPIVRKGVSKVISGFDSTLSVHAWALFIYLASIVLTLFSLTVFYKPDIIIESLKSLPLFMMAGLNALGFIGFSFIASGIFIYKPWKEVLADLGLVKISLKQLACFILVALVMAAVIEGMESYLMTFVDPQMRHNLVEIVKALNTSGSVQHTIQSAVLVGIAAGVGEEILFRGLIQPVFGIVATAILFAMIHTHYGPTVLLLELFSVGLVLGIIRKRWSTTAAIVVHSGFDFFAILSSLLHHH